jgi:hypothetical protein
MINTVKKWLDQELKRIEQDTKTLSRPLGKDINQNDQAHLIELKVLIHQLGNKPSKTTAS